ncbi:AAA family ATPase [Mucilaginibacter daejeonensis]|uniref:AAA family ATPase n=1 Tax=Mucilaginibacter daejeonensis TaxID=398049 RepID=UPI001D1761A8|nr:AAA family ATPase [Mucilaginibacter daejeonensis]UEG55037.1 AAA family ATPase [Mucilaginibacter daejeonensis]
MPFQPQSITREHILQAIAALKDNPKGIHASTGYDLHFEGRTYPPKAVLRKAHDLAVGGEIWERSGGPQTNDFLAQFGFEVRPKNDQPDPFPALIRDYKALVQEQGLHDEQYKWELLKSFKGRPDLDAPDLLKELKQINFANLIYGPGIGVMHHLARERAESYRDCLRGLFNDIEDLQLRCERFTSRIGPLYREVEADTKRQAHHDERTIATLLTFHDPERYAFYKDSFYQTLCKVLGRKSADPGKKYVDYMSIVNGFIVDYVQDDTELLKLVAQHQPVDTFADHHHFLLAQDILYRMLEINRRTFDSLIEELATTLRDDLEKPGFAIMTGTRGEHKRRDWVWVSDEAKIINTKSAHYELEVIPAKRDKIRICLHFEHKSNAGRFERQIGKLPEGIEWFKWFEGGRSIRLKQEIAFFGEQTIPQLIAGLRQLDIAVGNQVRKIITQMNQEIMLEKNKMKQPLNQILYGPPGTGKTYHTVNKALQIMGLDITAMSRTEMKAKFDQLVVEERIVFTSFHQSLGYEDFVEGLKPVLDNEDAVVRYEIKSGIFKNICGAARGLQDVKAQSKDIFMNAKFYKMSLGGLQNPHIHDWCLKNNCVGLGWGGDQNFEGFKGIKNWKEYRDKFVQEFPDLVNDSRYNITAMYAFQQMRIGDIVIISKGNHIIDAIGKITGDYEWDDNNDFGYFQFRKVEWLATGLNQPPSTFFRKQISQQSIYEFFDDDVKKEVFVDLFKSETPVAKPYVLIIDEINRGNIAKIFGELITLIEPDKRLGHAEGLTVTLPYTRDDFGVPANLYLIGTMNTADRSVEALDTALRRRFSFKEMEPRPELLSPAHIVWRFLWKYEDLAWEDKDYLVYEQELFDLLQPDEQFKIDRKETWDSFKVQEVAQIDLFRAYAYEGINLEKLLRTVNDRLEVLKDRDHLIGHAYFLQVYSLDQFMTVFRDNLIPLLQEYFFGDYYKIQLVIGSGFITSVTNAVTFAIADEDQFDEKEIYSINKSALNDSKLFIDALALMKL